MTNARTTRERAAAMRRQEQAKAKRRQKLVVGGVIGGIALVVVAIVLIVIFAGGSSKKTGPIALPAGVSGNSGPIVVGTGPAKLDVYEDFQCPSCGAFHKASGPTIAELQSSGKVTTNYHLVSFLGPESVRAANAAGCAQDQVKFKPFYDYLYAHQPPEKTGGYTPDELIKAGEAVGITSPAFNQCVTSMKYQDWVNNVNLSGGEKTSQTPTLFVNGKKIDDLTSENIKQAVNSAG